MKRSKDKEDSIYTILNDKISRIPKHKIQDFVVDFIKLLDSYIEE